MAKFGHFGGGSSMGGGNMQMQNLMRQAQEMQQKAMVAQEEIDATILEGSAGGNMVTVKATGAKQITEIKINPAVIDPDDASMLEDLVLAAINDVFSKADKLKEEKLGALGGLGGLM